MSAGRAVVSIHITRTPALTPGSGFDGVRAVADERRVVRRNTAPAVIIPKVSPPPTTGDRPCRRKFCDQADTDSAMSSQSLAGGCQRRALRRISMALSDSFAGDPPLADPQMVHREAFIFMSRATACMTQR